MKFIKLFSILSIFTLALTSCSDDDHPEQIHEEEVITTMNVVLTEDGTNNTVTLKSVDLDGDLGDAPVITGGTLKANTTYNGVITLLNESEDITEEVAEEADEHQFFYSATDLSSTFTYAGDNDSEGNPVGIKFTIQTSEAGEGTYVITLKHEPNKSGAGVKEGDITNAGGDTDIEVVFPITVEASIIKVIKI
ncbi:type 1 periplasmic binding fold superfamily protein [Tenacibaculum aestuariivivum]|uniref:type 1 periplasmic binding fold superfamily protein n=1 Tax=Tenacibaculum aestuariivivum TaxID=2006131 RepID=UPI003AB85028